MYYGISILLSPSCSCLIVNSLYIPSIYITLILLLMLLFPLPSFYPSLQYSWSLCLLLYYSSTGRMIAKPNPLYRSISSTYHLATIRPSNESKGSSSSALATINNDNQALIIVSALVTKGRLLTTKSPTPYDELAKTYRPTDRPTDLSSCPATIII